MQVPGVAVVAAVVAVAIQSQMLLPPSLNRHSLPLRQVRSPLEEDGVLVEEDVGAEVVAAVEGAGDETTIEEANGRPIICTS